MTSLNDEITSLTAQLSDIEKRIVEITGGTVDAVMDKDGESFLLGRAQQHLSQNAEFQRKVAAQQTAILNALPAHIAVLDGESRILEVNEAWHLFAQRNGFPETRAGLGESYLKVCERAQDLFADITSADDAGKAAAGIGAVLEGVHDNFTLEYPCHSPEEQRWFKMTVTPMPADAGLGAVVMHIDITERKRAQIEQQRAARVFTASSDGVIITDGSGIILDVNPAFSSITGYEKEEVLGQHPLILKDDTRHSASGKKMWHALDTLNYWQGESSNRRKNGENYTQHLSVSVIRGEEGDVINYIVMFCDVTQSKAHDAALEHLAHHDLLTGLPNRRLLTDRLQQAKRQSRRNQETLAICYIDLDNFKPINDRFGHAAGDQVLIEVTARLRGMLRDTDTVSRIGGDEFVLLLPGVKTAELSELLERLMCKVREIIVIADKPVEVSVSMGVVLFPDDDVNPDTLLRHADQAMYIAKESGRNRYHIYDPKLARKAEERILRLKHILNGLHNHEFALHYQPKVNMRNGEIIGVEALVRWAHPKLGLLAPTDFLDIIIGSDVEIIFGEYVLDCAVSQIHAWNQLHMPLKISINVSGNELLQPDLSEKIITAISRYPSVKPDQLEIEVLETAAIKDIAQAIVNLNGCREAGLQVSLDDFGTGYSSLTILRTLAVDTLKIDQSFVRSMLHDPSDQSMVESVIRMAQAFDRQVIAEGVETMEHARELLALGCEQGQGYWIARPMPADDIPAWILQWQITRSWDSTNQ